MVSWSLNAKNYVTNFQGRHDDETETCSGETDSYCSGEAWPGDQFQNKARPWWQAGDGNEEMISV